MATLERSVYLLLFGGATLGCAWGLFQARRFDQADIRRPFLAFLGLTTVWGAASTLLLVVRSPELMYVIYIGGLSVGLSTVLAWLWFCSAYAGRTYHHDRRIQLASVGTLAAVLAFKLSDPIHGLYIRPAVATEPFRHFAPELSAAYWFITSLAYTGAAVGLFMLFETYYGSGFATGRVGLLTAAIALPVVPKLLVAFLPDLLLSYYYEPVGAAVFAVGVATVAREEFLSVRQPARRQLGDQLEQAVVVVDERSRIVDHNAKARRLFPDLDARTGDPAPAVVPQLVATDDGSPLQRSVGGQDRYYAVQMSPIRLGSRQVGRVYVLTDVTVLDEQRRQLERQTDHREALTKAMAHELRNPLTVILGQLEQLSTPREDRNADDEAQSVELASDAAARMRDVVDDLMSIVRHGKPITSTDPCDLEDILWEAWPGAPGTLTVDADGRVLADKVRCTEMLACVFEAHDLRGATSVRATLEGDCLVVESDADPFDVKDTDSVFEYGVEAGGDTRTRVVLANAWTLANLHGWEMTVEATADDGLRVVVDSLQRADTDEFGPSATQ